MRLQVNIQDGEIMVSADDNMIYVTPITLKETDQ
jgi:hypothetical protein